MDCGLEDHIAKKSAFAPVVVEFILYSMACTYGKRMALG